MVMAWKKIGVIAVLIGGLFFTYHSVRNTNYVAETTFVLETEAGGSLGQLSSLANLAGVNLSALAENSSLFQIDNIVELYKSYSILKSTLLTHTDVNGTRQRLISWYGQENDLLSDWQESAVDFEVSDEQITVRHDSVLKEVTEDILEKNLWVGKPSRKLSILRVSYESKDEYFAKTFNEALVSNVNTFYVNSKTKKTGENLRVLSHQADSVKSILDKKIADLAQFEESNPNLNPLRAQASVPRQKLLIDLQTSSTVYQEIVKNLEIAKIAHRNNTPLIQLIDKPVLPLKDDKWKWYKSLVIGLFIGGVLSIAFLTAQRTYRTIMNNVD